MLNFYPPPPPRQYLFTRFWKPALAFLTNVLFIIFSGGRYRPGQRQRMAQERAMAALIASNPVTLEDEEEVETAPRENVKVRLPKEVELALKEESTSGRAEDGVNAPETGGVAGASETGGAEEGGVKKAKVGAKGALEKGGDAVKGAAQAVKEGGEKAEGAAQSAAGGVKRRVKRATSAAAEGAKEAAGGVKRTARAAREKVTGGGEDAIRKVQDKWGGEEK
jgi:hypothetical protein